jgi:hypothetical protein
MYLHGGVFGLIFIERGGDLKRIRISSSNKTETVKKQRDKQIKHLRKKI